MISQDRVTSDNLKCQPVNHLTAKFDGHRHCGSENMCLLCHVTSHNHVFIELSHFMSETPSQLATILPYLVVIGLVKVEI